MIILIFDFHKKEHKCKTDKRGFDNMHNYYDDSKQKASLKWQNKKLAQAFNFLEIFYPEETIPTFEKQEFQ